MLNKIKNVEVLSIIITLILSSFIGFSINITLKYSRVDSWITILLCFLLSIPSLIIFIIIFNYKEDLPINKKIEILFGKKIGTIINTYFLISSTLNAICYLYSFTCFIKSEYLKTLDSFKNGQDI